MTDQEIYNKIVDHLLDMDKPAKSDLSCEYQTVDGRRCAVGAILPDETDELGGWFRFHGDVAELLVEHDQLIGLLGLEDASIKFPDEDEFDDEYGPSDPRAVGRTVDLLFALQGIHDAPSHWNKPDGGLTVTACHKLRDIAEEFNLTTPDTLKEATRA